MTKRAYQKDLEIFALDMEVFGFNAETLKEERVILDACETVEDYIRASRVGRTVRLSRADKREIFKSYSLWVQDIKEVA